MDFPQTTRAHPWHSRAAAPPCSAQSDSFARIRGMRTTDSNRVAADRGHRGPAAGSNSEVYSERDRPPRFARLRNPEIQFRIDRGSSLRTSRTGSRYGTVQAQGPEM